MFISSVLQTEYMAARNCNDIAKIETIQKTAVEYFYFLTTVITEEIKFYLPAYQLFTTCASKLGMVSLLCSLETIIRPYEPF